MLYLEESVSCIIFVLGLYMSNHRHNPCQCLLLHWCTVTREGKVLSCSRVLQQTARIWEVFFCLLEKASRSYGCRHFLLDSITDFLLW